jgi:putative restriction endonuclease
VAAYNYTCALTGYRVTTIDGASIIDAAHIHQFSMSRNNDPKNGIALCKNAHWMFDQGLWSLDEDYQVIVARTAFDEATRDQKSLRDFHGSKIALPSNTNLWPDPLHLAWHRKHKFCT